MDNLTQTTIEFARQKVVEGDTCCGDSEESPLYMACPNIATEVRLMPGNDWAWFCTSCADVIDEEQLGDTP